MTTEQNQSTVQTHRSRALKNKLKKQNMPIHNFATIFHLTQFLKAVCIQPYTHKPKTEVFAIAYLYVETQLSHIHALLAYHLDSPYCSA